MKLNIIKKNAMVLAALAIATASYTLMSFGNKDVSKEKVDDLRWFIVEETSSGYGYSASNPANGTPSPEAGCQSTEEATLCSVAFSESQINPVNGMPFETNPENALAANKRYKEEQ